MLPSDVLAIIKDHLTKYYLRQERPSVARVVIEIRIARGEQGLQPPTRRTVRWRLYAIDARDVMKARRGAKAARQQFAPVRGKNRAERALDIVQIDHMPAHIICCRERRSRPSLSRADMMLKARPG